MPSLVDGTLRPVGSQLLIRLTEAPERSSGGVILIDSAREQWNEGEVIAAGGGRDFVWGQYTAHVAVWAFAATRVLFQEHHLRLLDAREKLGMVRDEDLLGIVDGDGEILPLNDLLLVEIPQRETETKGGLVLPEGSQQRPDCGTILTYGPGKLRERGELFGTRQSVPEIMGFERGTDVRGMRVWFSGDAEVLDVGRQHVERWMMRAGDLVAMEANDDGA